MRDKLLREKIIFTFYFFLLNRNYLLFLLIFLYVIMSAPLIINIDDSSDDESVICIEETFDDDDYNNLYKGNCSYCTFRNINVPPTNVFTCSMCGLPNGPVDTPSTKGMNDNTSSLRLPSSSSSSSSSSLSVVKSTTISLSSYGGNLAPTTVGRRLTDTMNYGGSSSTSGSTVGLTCTSETDEPITRNVISRLRQQIRHNLQSIPSPLLPYTVALSSEADHFAQFDGYSCGYRNIQILCSALLRYPVFRNVLFGGCGYVPDIVTLQRLIEHAWSIGFDPTGYRQLKTILHTNKFIGSTECAIVLRYFGIPAQVIAFHSLDDPLFDEIVKKQNKAAAAASTLNTHSSSSSSTDTAEEYPNAILSPTVINQVLQARKEAENNQQDFFRCHGGNNDASKYIEKMMVGGVPIDGTTVSVKRVNVAENGTNISSFQPTKSIQLQNLTPVHRKYLQQRQSGLLKWLSTIFCSNNITKDENRTSPSSDTGTGTVGEKPSANNIPPFPVYFQHDGHSRTLVGWEIRPSQSNATKRKVDHSNGIPLSSSSSFSGNIATGPSKKQKIITVPPAEEKDVEIFLLILDPLTEPRAIQSALVPSMEPVASSSSSTTATTTVTNGGILTSVPPSSGSPKIPVWPRIIKRGLHTFNKAVYEAVYIPTDAVPVPIGSKEWEKLKLVQEQHYWSGYDKFSVESVIE